MYSVDGISPLIVSVTSTVLALRGDRVVKQPFINPNLRGILCWNGEAWKIGGRAVTGNDGDAVFCQLTEAVAQPSPHDAILTTFRAIEGPFAFVFLDMVNRRLYYGRDRLGRRSLLISLSEGSLSLCSIADLGLGTTWYEVEADGLYSSPLSPINNLSGSCNTWTPRRDSWLTIADDITNGQVGNVGGLLNDQAAVDPHIGVRFQALEFSTLIYKMVRAGSILIPLQLPPWHIILSIR